MNSLPDNLRNAVHEIMEFQGWPESTRDTFKEYLAGNTFEHTSCAFYGPAASGKSVLVQVADTLHGAMGRVDFVTVTTSTAPEPCFVANPSCLIEIMEENFHQLIFLLPQPMSMQWLHSVLSEDNPFLCHDY